MHAEQAPEHENSGQMIPAQPREVDALVQRLVLAVIGTILLDDGQFREQTEASSCSSSNHTGASRESSISSSAGTTRRLLEACSDALKVLCVRSRRVQRTMEQNQLRIGAKRERRGGTKASTARAHHKASLQHASMCVQQIGCDLMVMQRAIVAQCGSCRHAWQVVHKVSASRNRPVVDSQPSESPRRRWKLCKAQAMTWNAIGCMSSKKLDEKDRPR